MRRGAGRGSCGTGFARQARQKAVKTWKGLPLALRIVPGSNKHIAWATLRCNPALEQPPLRAARRARSPQARNSGSSSTGCGARVRRQRQKRFHHRAPAHDEPRSTAGECGFEGAQRLMQPPSRRRPGPPRRLLFRRPEEDRQDGGVPSQRPFERRVVGKPQVAIEPHQGRTLAHVLYSSPIAAPACAPRVRAKLGTHARLHWSDRSRHHQHAIPDLSTAPGKSSPARRRSTSRSIRSPDGWSTIRRRSGSARGK